MKKGTNILIGLLALMVSTVNAQSTFPDEWLGDYQGEMFVVSTGRPMDTIPVDFVMKEIVPDSIWSYTMTYHSQRYGEITKDYRYVRSRKGDDVNFIFDEQNGIIMEMTMLNDCFYGMYEVAGSYFTNSFRRHGDQLFFELTMSPANDPKISSATEGEETFEAKSYKPTMVQSVLLSRKK